MTTMNNEMKSNMQDDCPWYKQWMVWMVIAPPAAAVVAGIITINIAINSDDGLVVDDYYKQGLGINQTLQRDQLARDMGLDAAMAIEGEVVTLQFDTEMTDPVLFLSFIHPTQSQRDIKVNLGLFASNAYKAQMEQPLTGNWNVLLEPEDKSWRISGRINMPADKTSQLMPNLK